MNFWLAILLSVIVGMLFGGAFKSKDKRFSWLAFFITLFIVMGGLKIIFGLLLVPFIFLMTLIPILFWLGIIALVIVGLHKVISK